MVATSDALYVLGGNIYEETEVCKPILSIEKYNFATKHWEEYGTLTQPAAYTSTIVSDNKVYLFGGLQGLDRQTGSTEEEPLHTFQCFGISTKVCTSITLPSLPEVNKAIQCDDQTYLFGLNGEICKLDRKYIINHSTECPVRVKFRLRGSPERWCFLHNVLQHEINLKPGKW